MDQPLSDNKMEGWLYMIRSNRFGLQYSRKRYFVLEDQHLKSFKSVPDSDYQDPVRSAVIDSCIRVTDNGRESIQRKVFFIFTLYNTSNHDDELKLGASGPDEAARWIQTLQEVSLKDGSNITHNVQSCLKSSCRSLRQFSYLVGIVLLKKSVRKGLIDFARLQVLQTLFVKFYSFTDSMSVELVLVLDTLMTFSCRFSGSSRIHQSNSIDWTLNSSTYADPVSSDVIAPSLWTISGCQNGLRLFKEPNINDGSRKQDDHPALMAVGMVEGTAEAIFQTLMSLGPSRSEWDFCFYKGSVVEHLDGHTDIIHKQLHSEWMPWGMGRRDLLLRRYWRRDDDGTYVILYHSVFHKRCPVQRGYVRACLKSGGYVITPTNRGKQSVVKHMLAIDWKFWRSYWKPSLARSITIKMLERIAALREMFRAKSGNMSSHFSSGQLSTEIQECVSDSRTEAEIWRAENNGNALGSSELDRGRPLSRRASLGDLNDAADEFFDVPDQSDYDHLEDDWTSDFGPECQDLHHSRLSTAAMFVKKLHGLAVQKRGYMDLQDTESVDRDSCCYGCTLLKDSTYALLSSYSAADPSTFLIRGKSFFDDNQKVKANGTLMQLVGADWIRSDMREDNLGGRSTSLVQKHAAKGGPEFFFIVNIQVPGSSPHSLAFYYMMNTPLEEVPLLESFANGDDAFRNSRFKLIPCIAKGPWIVKQTVRNRACLVGQQLHINYFRGKNYLEVGIDIGSSTLARGAVSLVFGYLSHLVIEMAFLIQAETNEELPEFLLGTCRLNHLDPSKSVPIT